MVSDQFEGSPIHEISGCENERYSFILYISIVVLRSLKGSGGKCNGVFRAIGHYMGQYHSLRHPQPNEWVGLGHSGQI